MKKILFFISIITLLGFTGAITKNTTVLVTPNSKLFIEGKTNVSSFICRFNMSNLKKPIPVFYKKEEGKMIFNNTALVLENDCFDCGGKAINNEFKELLKSTVYPKTYIYLKALDIDNNDLSCVFANIDIDMAGVIKPYKIPVQLRQDDELHIHGVLNLDICDFNLEPPKKALGLIVVKNMIEINFDLIVKEYEN